jgi:hypothetical protein
MTQNNALLVCVWCILLCCESVGDSEDMQELELEANEVCGHCEYANFDLMAL